MKLIIFATFTPELWNHFQYHDVTHSKVYTYIQYLVGLLISYHVMTMMMQSKFVRKVEQKFTKLAGFISDKFMHTMEYFYYYKPHVKSTWCVYCMCTHYENVATWWKKQSCKLNTFILYRRSYTLKLKLMHGKEQNTTLRKDSHDRLLGFWFLIFTTAWFFFDRPRGFFLSSILYKFTFSNILVMYTCDTILIFLSSSSSHAKPVLLLQFFNVIKFQSLIC